MATTPLMYLQTSGHCEENQVQTRSQPIDKGGGGTPRISDGCEAESGRGPPAQRAFDAADEVGDVVAGVGLARDEEWPSVQRAQAPAVGWEGRLSTQPDWSAGPAPGWCHCYGCGMCLCLCFILSLCFVSDVLVFRMRLLPGNA